MAQLFFRYGTMNSGKSLQLLSVAHNYEEQGKKVVILTSSLDTRSGANKVESRIGVSHTAFTLGQKDDDLFNILGGDAGKNVSCILVDEAQFLTKLQVIQLGALVDTSGIPVICYGLKNDYKGNLFEGSQALLTYADKLEEIKTVCELCDKKATMNLLVSDTGKAITSGKQVIIGDKQFHSLCRSHFWNAVNQTKNNPLYNYYDSIDKQSQK